MFAVSSAFVTRWWHSSTRAAARAVLARLVARDNAVRDNALPGATSKHRTVIHIAPDAAHSKNILAKLAEKWGE